MTKTIVIGAQTEPQSKKPIVFERMLDITLQLNDASGRPSSFDYIELICANYVEGLDLMFAYDDKNNRSDGTLYIGKWNDGIV